MVESIGFRIERQWVNRAWFITLIMVVFSLSFTVCADQGSPASGPDVTVTGCDAVINAAVINDVPIGTIPDERIDLTIRVENVGIREAPGYRIKMYLVKEGREDTIAAQIGSDLTDTRLPAGESREYSKNYMIPKFLKSGYYRVLILLDSADYFPEENTGNNRYLSEKSLLVGNKEGPAGTIPVYSPGTLEKPGTYILKRNIDLPNKNEVFQITSSDVTLDGGGNTISGTSTGFSIGVNVDANKNIQNVVIKNLNVEGFDTGIWLYKASSGEISGCNLSNNRQYGLRIDQTQDNRIQGNHFSGNGIGLGLFQSIGSLVSNNYFKNQYNAVVNEGKKNLWNGEPVPGTNIIGGSTIAGNAWFSINGTSFSEMNTDLDGDGISESPFTLAPDNIDYYPLIVHPGAVIPQTPVQAPGTVIEDIPEPEGVPEPEVTKEVQTPAEPVKQAEPVILQETPVQTPTPTPVADVSPEDTPEKTTKPGNTYLDLAVSSITIPESICLSEPLPIRLEVMNKGGYPSGLFLIHYYLSDDQRVSKDDISLVLEEADSPLNPGETRVVETGITLPENTGVKRYFVIASAEPAGDTYEENIMNNARASEQRIEIHYC